MGQFYSDRNREKDRFSIPDAEVFWVDAGQWGYDQFGERCDMPGDDDLADQDGNCPECGHPANNTSGHGTCDGPAHDPPVPCRAGWYYWHCFPGCLPDSEPIGPFDTEGEAMADARKNAGEELEEGDDNADD